MEEQLKFQDEKDQVDLELGPMAMDDMLNATWRQHQTAKCAEKPIVDRQARLGELHNMLEARTEEQLKDYRTLMSVLGDALGEDAGGIYLTPASSFSYLAL